MLRSIVLVVACVFVSSHVLAGEVPGTSVSLTPPSGFVEANRFPGFMKESTGSSIMISEMPGAYAEVAAGFSDEKRMQAQGIKVLSKSSATVDGHGAMLLHAEQSGHGTVFRKWIVAVDRSGSTVLIVGTYPKEETKNEEEPLKAAILAASFGKATDPSEALAFAVAPEAPFEVAKVMGQNMILSPGGQFPLRDESVPFMVLGLSASTGLVVADQKAFAERRVSKNATVSNISVERSTPFTVGNLSGYATTAKGEGQYTATPLTIYQVLLFDVAGYCVIQGVTPSAKRSTYLPVFEKIARTFAIKEPRDKAIGNDQK